MHITIVAHVIISETEMVWKYIGRCMIYIIWIVAYIYTNDEWLALVKPNGTAGGFFLQIKLFDKWDT